MKDLRLLALAQGLYYSAAGIWPLVHMPSFLAVTGPKTDLWLVETVGILVAVLGLALVSASVRNRVTLEIGGLAAGSAAGLAAVEFYYGMAGRIWPVYLLDAVGETALVLLWVGFAVLARRQRAVKAAP